MMTNNSPVYALAPLEYRLGLDAACTWLTTQLPLCLRCDQPVLLPEVEQRLDHTLLPPWSSGLWLEPQLTSWQFALTEFSANLPSKAPMAVLLSLPLARCLPGNQSWLGVPLGKQRGGLKQFVRSLNEYGFELHSLHGLHSAKAILLNAASLFVRKAGRFTWGDQLEFAARKCYTRPLSMPWFATCALILVNRR